MAGRARLRYGTCLRLGALWLAAASLSDRYVAFAGNLRGPKRSLSMCNPRAVRRASNEVMDASAIDLPNSSEDEKAISELAQTYRDIWSLLEERAPATVEEVPSTLHELSPPTPRAAWQELGRLATACETPSSLHGEKWVTIRLDGCMFGTLTKRMREAGLIGPGYSDEVGEIMQLGRPWKQRSLWPFAAKPLT